MVSVPSSATSTSTLPASAAGTVTVRPPGTVSTLLPFTATSSRMASDLLPPAPVTVTDSAVNDTVLPLCFASSDRPLAGDGMPAMGVDTVRSRLSPAMSLTDDFGSSTVTLEASPSISGGHHDGGDAAVLSGLLQHLFHRFGVHLGGGLALAVHRGFRCDGDGAAAGFPDFLRHLFDAGDGPPLMLLPCSSIHSTAALNFSTSAMVI